jgi:hypothetical protein
MPGYFSVAGAFLILSFLVSLPVGEASRVRSAQRVEKTWLDIRHYLRPY